MEAGSQNNDRSEGKKQWVVIAIGAIVICVVIAIILFAGIGSGLFGHGGRASSVAPGTVRISGQAMQSSSAPGTNGFAATINYSTAVPGTGTYVQVKYTGGFTGSYTANGTTQNVMSSGYQLYAVNQEGGTVTAAFIKDDDSTKHNLTAEIWKDGRLLASNSTSAPYGNVSLSASV
jgi:hypothetical protein